MVQNVKYNNLSLFIFQKTTGEELVSFENNLIVKTE